MKVYVGRSLAEGPGPLEDLSKFFHRAGYAVYMPYDDDTKNSPAEIKSKDMDAIRSSDAVVLELRETSLGVAQELGAARALGKPVILITESQRVVSHNWVRGDEGIRCCGSKEGALDLLGSFQRVESFQR
jgi:nucleoside 2-deoxyribosyltransferase